MAAIFKSTAFAIEYEVSEHIINRYSNTLCVKFQCLTNEKEYFFIFDKDITVLKKGGGVFAISRH